jgi:hypothetical protein
VAIPLTSESAPAPAAPVDGDQGPFVELREGDLGLVALVREADDSAIAGGVVATATGGGRKGKRAEYRCAACRYGIIACGQLPSCPMCGEARWQHAEWRPFSQLLDLPVATLDLPVATGSQRHRLHVPSIANGRGRADPLRSRADPLSLSQLSQPVGASLPEAARSCPPAKKGARHGSSGH